MTSPRYSIRKSISRVLLDFWKKKVLWPRLWSMASTAFSMTAPLFTERSPETIRDAMSGPVISVRMPVSAMYTLNDLSFTFLLRGSLGSDTLLTFRATPAPVSHSRDGP